MLSSAKIYLRVPYTDDNDHKFFSCSLRTEHPISPTEYKTPTRMILLSDIMGDFKELQRYLVRNKVIDATKHRWIFGSGHVVILGSSSAWTPETIEGLWLIYALEQRASLQGGRVHYLLGETDIQNLSGEWRFEHPKYARRGRHNLALFDGNMTLWNWLKTKNMVERIGNVLVMPNLMVTGFYTILSLQDLNKQFHKQFANGQYAYHLPVHEVNYSITELSVQWKELLSKLSISTIITSADPAEILAPLTAASSIPLHVIPFNHQPGGILIKHNHLYRINNKGIKERIN